MKNPTLSFLGNFANNAPVKVPLHDGTVRVTCSISKGYPSPIFTASIVNSKGSIIRDLEEIKSPELGVSIENPEDLTFSETKSFKLNMTQDDVGNYVQCHSNQGVGFEVRDTRELAVWCNCSDVGSQDQDCDPQSGQCKCYPNFSGINCNDCAKDFLGHPQCTGTHSKSV